MADENEPEVKNSLSAFKASKKFAWFDKYKAGGDLSKSPLDASGFNTYEQERIKGIDGFNEITTAGTSFTEKLKTAAAGNPGHEAKEKITGALKSDELAQAQKNFNDELATLNKLLTTETPNFHPGEIGSCLLALKGEAKAAIEAQHAKAKENLKQLFETDAGFQKDLRDSLACSDADLVKLKDDMANALDKSKQEALSKLEKSIEDSANKLFNASKEQFERLAFLGDRFNRDKEMAEDMRSQMVEAEEPGYMEVNFENGDATFKGVDINKLKVFNTIQGRTITKNPNGSLHMELNRIYQSDESIRKDVASLVQTLMAMGKQPITLNITNKDPKQAEYDARLAFEGAIAAGLDPKKLVVQVNGETKFQYNEQGNLDDNLFKEHKQRLDVALKKAEKIADKTAGRIEGTTDSTRRLRQELRAMNNQLPALPGTSPSPG